MNNEFASFEKTPANTSPDDINMEQIEEIAIIGEQHDDTPRETYQERGIKAESAVGNQPTTEVLEASETIEVPEASPKEPSAEDHQQALLDGILQVDGLIHSESQSAPAEDQNGLKDKIKGIINKAKNTRGFKIAVAGLMAASISFSLAACGDKQTTGNDQEPTSTTTQEQAAAYEQTAVSGEQANGVSYDYRHYLDYENKDSKNAYDYSLVDRYGDRDATIDGMMDVAERNPEALASYAYQILNEEEKQELGINGMNMTQIDDTMSNDENGGKLQKNILNKLEEVLKNEDGTRFDYYLENDFEETSYVYFVDDNNDGTATPEEMHIGYATTKRDGAPQVNILRKTDTADGKTVWALAADINLKCGGQVNYNKGEFPEGVPKIDQNNPTPKTTTETPTKPTPKTTTKPTPKTTTTPTPTPTPKTTTQWGKSGDPHGGNRVTPSEMVNPKSMVTKEENDNTNRGNQGYRDDNKATPGSSSNNNLGNNSSNNTNSNRLSGGVNQGGSQTNGENAYHSPSQNIQGQRVDNSGNVAQQEARQSGGENGGGASAGGNNYSDAGEEAAVENGDF